MEAGRIFKDLAGLSLPFSSRPPGLQKLGSSALLMKRRLPIWSGVECSIYSKRSSVSIYSNRSRGLRINIELVILLSLSRMAVPRLKVSEFDTRRFTDWSFVVMQTAANCSSRGNMQTAVNRSSRGSMQTAVNRSSRRNIQTAANHSKRRKIQWI